MEDDSSLSPVLNPVEPFTVYTFQLNTKDPVVTLDIPSFKDIPYIQNMDENTKALPAEKINVVYKLDSKTPPAENVHDEEESNTEEKVHEEDKLENKTLPAENMHDEDKDCTFALDRYVS